MAIGQAIAAFGARGVPSGELYARIMGAVDRETYQGAIGLLKRTGIVTERNHVLRISMKGEGK